tara:strand:+ start:234 stop:977 length:744 start_codon:yes stop_codon:yes gene_type:complete
MAISVDTVYQRVLALANKEQRGYITPQEFNLYANQAQLEILNQYFYDTNQFGRGHGNSTEYGDIMEFLHEKVNMLTKTSTLKCNQNNEYCWFPSSMYKLGSVMLTVSNVSREIEPVNENELMNMNSSPLTKPNIDRPVYTSGRKMIGGKPRHVIYPSPSVSGLVGSGDIRAVYINKPIKAEWSYVVVNGKALYNSHNSVDFELHESEETNLVYRILALAGITLADTGSMVYQAAVNEENNTIKQQKA